MQTTLAKSALVSLEWQSLHRRSTRLAATTKFEISSAVLITSFIIFAALITIMTLSFSGKAVTKGYTIKQLEAQRQTLMRENEVIGAKLAEAQAMQSALTSPRAQTMINLTESRITYLRGESNLAKKYPYR
ncbi:hypothetical protein HZA39_01195 [Candidatus Peregrinibacteria bacterium]|nr:hypothetical protein [Candidatus Peregrinibacteria bacterium]